MKIVPLSDPPYSRRPNEKYEAKRTMLMSTNPILADAIPMMEERILRMPLSVGKWGVDPPNVRHVKVANHWVIFWRVHQGTREVEFIQIGHHDEFFVR
ncbi:MAG: hypothetical protein QXH42_10155 [Thermoplasmata archaeon]